MTLRSSEMRINISMVFSGMLRRKSSQAVQQQGVENVQKYEEANLLLKLMAI